MHPHKINILIAWTCLAAIVESSKPDESSVLAETTAEVLKLCYRNLTNVVGLAGNLDGLLNKPLRFDETLAVTLIDAGGLETKPVQQEPRYKLQVFLVVTSSASELMEILMEIRNTTWWNHQASFLILDRPSGSQKGCSNAFDILLTAFKMDLLNAKFVCLHPIRDQLLYSFNPYAKLAPDSWILEETCSESHPAEDHPCALFARGFQIDPTTCKDLDFDKTADLAGHRIRTSEIHYATDRRCMNLSENAINELIFRTLNATYRPDGCAEPGPVNSTIDDDFADVKNGFSDISLNARIQPVFVNFTTTYPHWSSGISVVTQPPGYMSQFSKIKNQVDGDTRHGFWMVLLITLLFFKLVPRHSRPSSAILNTMLIICNMPLVKVPGRVGPRIYLGSLFLFVLTIRAVYQGDLSSLLTLPVPLPAVETMQDLVKLGYTVYGHKSYRPLFKDSDLEDRFVAMKRYNCTSCVLSDPLAACLRSYDKLIPEVEQFDLHLCKDRIFRFHVVYAIRENWPLERRLNLILRRMSETGIIKRIKMQITQSTISRLDFLKELKKVKKFRVITLDQLTFAFVVLGVGLCCSSVVFVVEVIRVRIRNKGLI